MDRDRRLARAGRAWFGIKAKDGVRARLSWRTLGILYLVATGLACQLAPVSELARSLLSLPAAVLLPLQIGGLCLEATRALARDLPRARHPIARGLLGWWTGLVALAGVANGLQHLGLAAILRTLPWIALGVAAADALYRLARGQQGWGVAPHALLNELRHEGSAVVALALGSASLWIYKRQYPFPHFMRNSFTLANMVYQPVVRLLRDGYLTFEPSHKAGSYLLVWLPSALYKVDPLAMAWSLPILQVAAFALGLYLWAREVSGSRLLAALAPLFGGFLLSAGPLFETTPVVFRSNSVQLALLPLTLWALQRYTERRPSGRGLALPALLAAAGIAAWFAVVHSDKLFWSARLQALHPGQDPVRLLHMYGVQWSARTTAVIGWLALPTAFLVRSLLGRDHPHRELIPAFALLTAFQFQLHAWEAPIFLGIAWAYLLAWYALERRALWPIVYGVLACLVLLVLLQWVGVLAFHGTGPLFRAFFYWVSTSPETPRAIDLVETLRNAHAPLTLGLWALGTAGILAQRKKAGLLVTSMAALGLLVYFAPEPNGVRAYKVVLPFAAYALAWVVAQTYQALAGSPRKVIRPLALLAFAAALAWVGWELVEPYQRYYSRSVPGQPYALYMADYEQLTLDWLRAHAPENARLISDPHSTHLFSELTNSIDPLEHAMTTTEMSSFGQRQVREIKNEVFGAENSGAAQRALRDLAGYTLSFRNRDYAQKSGRDTSEPTTLILLSGKTSRWIADHDIEAIYDPVVEPIDAAHLAPFDDLRTFRLRYQVGQQMMVYEARRLEPRELGTALDWVGQGNERWFEGQEEAAMVLYKRALERDPKEVEAHVALGEVYRQRGEWAAAIQMLEEAVRLAPSEDDLSRALGDTYLIHGEPLQAVEAYRRALELAPDRLALHARIGDAYLAQGDVHAACQAYRASVRSPYGQAETLARLGDLYSDKRLAEAAERAYREALNMNPRLTVAYQGLGRLYRAAGRRDQAIDAYETLTELDPHQAIWYEELGLLHVEQGRPDAALALYERASRRHPRSKELHLALGRLYQSLAREGGQ